MESNSLRGLFGPRPVEQRVAPQPTEPIENEYENEIPYEYPLGMIEKLLANPFTGDGTKHPDEHLIYVGESLQVYPMMLLRRRYSLYF